MPSGNLNYYSAEAIIESVAESKANQFKNIGWLDEEDLKQEVRLKCWQTLHKYNKRRSDLYIFLSRCADNRLRDIRRSICYKHNKPCLRCPFWKPESAAKGKHDCSAFRDKLKCDKYAKHEKYVQIKLSISHSMSIDEDRIYDSKFSNKLLQYDLVDFINVHIPSGHQYLFNMFASGNFDMRVLKPKERTELSEVLVDVMSIHQEKFND
jgi:hypothetical protein